MKGLNILGLGYYVPDNAVSNFDLEKKVETSNEWIKTRTGIESRRISENENTSELAYKASLKAIESANIDPSEIDLIVCATITPDTVTPSVACHVQGLLGLNDQRIMAFDLNAACSGFVYALNVVSGLLNSGSYKCALVIGAETLSKIVDFNDRATCILFGDGAGAMVCKLDDKKESYFYSRSRYDEKKVLYAPSFTLTNKLDNSDGSDHYLKMNGQEVFKFACGAMEDGIEEILKLSGKSIDEIDFVIPHQANLRIINHVIKKYNLDENKVYVNVDKYGNTSAASIIIALAEGYENNIIKKGMKIILVGFGAGLTWTSSYLEL